MKLLLFIGLLRRFLFFVEPTLCEMSRIYILDGFNGIIGFDGRSSSVSTFGPLYGWYAGSFGELAKPDKALAVSKEEALPAA